MSYYDHAREEAEGDSLLGYFARKNGRSFEQDAPPEGTPAHASYQRGWNEADREIAAQAAAGEGM